MPLRDLTELFFGIHHPSLTQLRVWHEENQGKQAFARGSELLASPLDTSCSEKRTPTIQRIMQS